MKNNAAPHLNQFYQFNYCSIPLWIWFQLRASIFFTWKPPRPWWNLKFSAEICTKTEVAVMMSGGEMPMLTVLRSSWSPIFSGRFSRHAWWLNPYFGWQSPYDFPHIFSTSENWNSQQISHWLPLMSSYSPPPENGHKFRQRPWFCASSWVRAWPQPSSASPTVKSSCRSALVLDLVTFGGTKMNKTCWFLTCFFLEIYTEI